MPESLRKKERTLLNYLSPERSEALRGRRPRQAERLAERAPQITDKGHRTIWRKTYKANCKI
jgi:hypothetical protein